VPVGVSGVDCAVVDGAGAGHVTLPGEPNSRLLKCPRALYLDESKEVDRDFERIRCSHVRTVSARFNRLPPLSSSSITWRALGRSCIHVGASISPSSMPFPPPRGSRGHQAVASPVATLGEEQKGTVGDRDAALVAVTLYLEVVALQCDGSPDRLDDAERPCSGEKSVGA
jgi:hypothetical protein